MILKNACHSYHHTEFRTYKDHATYYPCADVEFFAAAMKPHKLSDKYGDALSDITDYLVCLCLYPGSRETTGWRINLGELCRWFIDLDIEPLESNSYDNRHKWLKMAVTEILNADYSAIRHHFRSISIYYAHQFDSPNRLPPHKTIEELYEEYRDKVIAGIETMTQLIARQDYSATLNYINAY